MIKTPRAGASGVEVFTLFAVLKPRGEMLLVGEIVPRIVRLEA